MDAAIPFEDSITSLQASGEGRHVIRISLLDTNSSIDDATFEPLFLN